ncbi:MAG: methylmalonyl Co-A mutase-associated GTPase MeaB [Planctomycetes bacterium]|nr:methylmalonyl Co-A mutase-associated GTPase MeaB [Planctomycetota bacterium]
MSMQPTIPELVAKLAASEGTARLRPAGRLITAMVERPNAAATLVEALNGRDLPRPPLVIGFTGAPGAGKSTLVDAVTARLLERRPDLRIAILAVDPTSPFTGGAVLGDRVRMMRLALEERVFIRSLATRGQLGGVCEALPGVLAVATLWGADVALVETVGVGQSEIDIARHADMSCIVMAPGLGDGVQWLKAGLMEVGDAFLVNKCDRDGATTLHSQLLSAVESRQHAPRRRLRPAPVGMVLPQVPPVLSVSAELGQGLDDLLDILPLPAAAHH